MHYWCWAGVMGSHRLLGVGLLLLCFVSLHTLSANGSIESLTEKHGGSLHVLVIGDWGRRGLYNQSQLATQMGKVGKEVGVDFIISTGDNFYENGLTGVADTDFQDSFSKIYTAKSLQKIWHSVLGNHDYRGDVLAQLNPVLRARDNRWHCRRSFNLRYSLCTTSTADNKCKSSAQFFFIDTTPFVDEYWEIPNKHKYDWRGIAHRGKYIKRQLQDLTLALKDSTATWKIVVGHHPIRSVGHHGDTPELDLQLRPILERYNVDLYINGHDHCLEHISSVTSPIQFLTSGAGSKAWRGIDKEADMDGLQFYYDGQGFLSLEISPTNLRSAFYDIEGKIIHQLDLWSIEEAMQRRSVPIVCTVL